MFRTIGWISNVSAVAAGILLTVMMVHIVVEVMLRLLFGGYIPGTIEIVSNYYMVAAVFIGIFSATYRDSHIRVDVVAGLFKGYLRRVVDTVGGVITLLYFSVFAYGLYLRAVRSTARSEVVDAIFLELPIWPARWLAFLGMLLAGLAAAVLLRRAIAGADIDQRS